MPTYYSQGINRGPLSDRNHLSFKTIGHHNNYDCNHITIITNNFAEGWTPPTQTTTCIDKITI